MKSRLIALRLNLYIVTRIVTALVQLLFDMKQSERNRS